MLVASVVFWAFMLLDMQLGPVIIGRPSEEACEKLRQEWPVVQGQRKSDQCLMLIQPGGVEARGKARHPKIG